MKYVKHRLRLIAQKPVEEAKNELFIFDDSYQTDEDKRDRDLYKVARRYYSACKSLILQIPVRSKI